MFDRIAGVYDVMNSTMTAGMHHAWRERAVDRARVGPGSDALDICCGTGDLALELRRRIGPDGRVVGSDFSEQMLELARSKSGEQGLPVEFGWADALELPYGDAELRRGHGRLRSPQPRGPRRGPGRDGPRPAPGRPRRDPRDHPARARAARELLRPLVRPVVPLLGNLAGDPDAYSYLPESVRSFPDPRTLAAKMDAAGLRARSAGCCSPAGSSPSTAGRRAAEVACARGSPRTRHRGDRPRRAPGCRCGSPRPSGA